MKYKSESNAISITRDLIDRYVKDGDIVLDATVGNGNDTILLAEKVGISGRVYGFDIQKIAINNTISLLESKNLNENVILINKDHFKIDKYIDENLNFIIYNLGYLPKGDKSIKTKASTSIGSIEKSLNLLDYNGLLIITVYTGHAGGLEEKIAIENLIINLNQKNFTVLKYEFINQKNNPPIVYKIEKIKNGGNSIGKTS